MIKRICSFFLILCMTLGLTACGSTFSNLRAAVALASPLITYFASQGKIDGAKAEREKQDINDIIDVTERLDQQWKALPSDAFRSEKLAVIQSANKSYQAILNRGNFVNVPDQLQAALGVIDGIFDVLIAFYSPSTAFRKPGVYVAHDQAALLADVEARIKLLKQTLKKR